MEKEETTGELAIVKCKKCQRWIIEASVAVMLDKQLGQCWKHRTARVVGKKEKTAMEEANDDWDVQAERKEIEMEVGKHSPKQARHRKISKARETMPRYTTFTTH